MTKGQPTKFENVYRLPESEGSYWIRARAKDPKTGLRKDTSQTLPLFNPETGLRTTLDEALVAQVKLKASLGRIDQGNPARKRFGEYAHELIEAQIASGRTVTSPATAERYRAELKDHILPHWGTYYLDAIDYADCRKWLDKLGAYVKSEDYTPETVNGWWRTFKKIVREACREYRIYNPTEGLEAISTKLHRTYTDEEPNTLYAPEIYKFLDATYKYEREWFAEIMLGMLTGRRPCELRTLRHKGPTPDITWGTGRLLIRRSNSRGQAVQDYTKTKTDVVLCLPDVVTDALRSHVANMTSYQKGFDLFFPPYRRRTATAKEFFQARSALAKPIANVCEKLGMKKHLTPKGVTRRSYQKLCEQAQVSKLVQKVISGHATDDMVAKYTHIAATEGLTALTSMAQFAGIKEAARL